MTSLDPCWSLFTEKVAPYLQKLYQYPFEKKKATDGLLLVPTVRKVLDTQSFTSHLETHLSLPASFRSADPSVIGVVIFERLLEFELLSISSSFAREWNGKPSVQKLTELFKRWSMATQIMSRILCHHYNARKESHRSCRACFCLEQSNLFHPNRLAADVARDCWMVNVHSEMAYFIEISLTRRLKLEWSEDVCNNMELCDLMKVVSALPGCHAWIQSILRREFSLYCAHLIKHHSPDNPDHVQNFCPVICKTLKHTFQRATIWLPSPQWQGTLRKIAADAILPLIEKCFEGHFIEWVQQFQRELIESTFFLYCLNSNDSAFLPRWFRRAIQNELMSDDSSSPATSPRADPAEWMERVLGWKCKYEEMVARCFGGRSSFLQSVLEAAQCVLHGCSEELAATIHHALAKEKMLDERVIAVFNWVYPMLRETDVFLTNVSHHMEMRFLNPGFQLGGEKQLVSLLRDIRESRSMEMIIRDVEFSLELMPEAAKLVQRHFHKDPNAPMEHANMQFSCLFLTPNCWHSVGKGFALSIPSPLREFYSAATQAYKTKFARRVLDWNFRHSIGTLQFLFTKVKYEAAFPSVAALILLTFDSVGKDSISQADVAGLYGPNIVASGGYSQLVQKMIQLGILLGSESLLTLNRAFVHKQLKRSYKFSMLPAAKASTLSSHDDGIVRQREAILQAAVVRVMKSQKELQHNDLCIAVTNQVKARFLPSIPQIKKVIEILIQREYIVRKDDRTTYAYLA